MTRAVTIRKSSGFGEIVYVILDAAGGRELGRRGSLFLAKRWAQLMGWRVISEPIE